MDGVGGVPAGGRRSDPSKVERSPTGGGAAGVERWPAGRRPADGGPPPSSATCRMPTSRARLA